MATLEAVKLSKTYRGQSREVAVRALTDVSLSLEEGEIFALLGLNGAGKTSIVKIVAGLLLPDSGEVSVSGRSILGSPHRHASIGAVFEGNRNLYWRLTAAENLEYFAALRGLSARTARVRARTLLSQFNLSDKADVAVKELSRGMQQRLAFTCALMHQPRILLLDEPTLGVDIENLQLILQHLAELRRTGISILLTSHQLDIVQRVSDRVAIIKDGRILAIKPTSEVVKDVQTEAYVVEVGADLTDLQIATLESFGAKVDKHAITCNAPGGLLYEIMAVLKPVEILSVRKGELDFEAAFLETVRRG